MCCVTYRKSDQPRKFLSKLSKIVIRDYFERTLFFCLEHQTLDTEHRTSLIVVIMKKPRPWKQHLVNDREVQNAGSYVRSKSRGLLSCKSGNWKHTREARQGEDAGRDLEFERARVVDGGSSHVSRGRRRPRRFFTFARHLQASCARTRHSRQRSARLSVCWMSEERQPACLLV